MEADPTDDVLGPKKRNYDFLQLVRDKNYPDALLLGKLSISFDMQFSKIAPITLQSGNLLSSSKKMQSNVTCPLSSG